ncbi:MAG: hypothetical protein JSW60_05065 [Thermoplasmatales archaeon]|nr:MAG: hypothetical protein JSW60_05065 [Thermoplasmatales archaeon]
MTSEKIWTWRQSKGKIFKVISNASKGTIEVLDENGETVIRKTNLSRKQVEMVEKNFKNFVSKKLNGSNKTASQNNFDPMIT